jgi:uncharacterized protein
MKGPTPITAAILGLSIGIGIVISSIFIANAIYKARSTERFVTVKGLAEHEVDADLAIWPVTFKDVGNDLVQLQKLVEKRRKTITNFLIEKGFNSDNISYSAPRITDAQAEYYGNNPPPYRYRVQSTVTLRSSKVDLVKESMEASGDLVSKGVVLADNWENRTTFMFTALNDIKPEMIREATMNAREAAATFAKDSGSKVGKIRKATQGYFTISDRDQNSPDKKIVRVVTTLEYFLIDD